MVTTREDLFSALRERMLAFATSRLRNRDAAEDVAQEAFVVIQSKYRHLEDLENLLPLSFQILRYKISERMHAGSRAESVPVEDLPLAAADPPPDEIYEREELRRRLAAALRRLTGRCRELMRLKLEGKSFAEIRRILGAASINTVYTWDFRCRETLRQLLEAGGKGGGP